MAAASSSSLLYCSSFTIFGMMGLLAKATLDAERFNA